MASSSPNTPLFTQSRTSTYWKPARIDDYPRLSRTPNAPKTSSVVKPLSIKVENGPNGTVSGFLHLPASNSATSASKTSVIFLSGAGGGVIGPSSIYLSLAEKLSSLNPPMPTLRLDYRYPARTKYCVRDVLAAIRELQEAYQIQSFVLVGWSFGGAPVFTVAGRDKRVVGCVGIASQTADTEGIASLAPRPVLLLHGTGDAALTYQCSERLYDRYGEGGKRELRLFEGDDHALTGSSREVECIVGELVLGCAVLDPWPDGEGLNEVLVGEQEKVELMRRGGDLRTDENID